MSQRFINLFILSVGGFLLGSVTLTSSTLAQETPSRINPQTLPTSLQVGETLIAQQTHVKEYTGLSGYPLQEKASMGLAYGWYEIPNQEQPRFHSGLDLLAEVGTPVLAAEGGKVVFVGQRGNYGNVVMIEHSGGYQTRYAHLNQMTVRNGQRVTVGQQIGTVGTTGSPDINVAHLHFEVRYQFPVGWVAQDPLIHFPVIPQDQENLGDLLPGNRE